MEFISFPNDSVAQDLAMKLNARELAIPNLYPWALLEQTGFAEPLLDIIRPSYPDGFTDESLRVVFQNTLPIYKPLVVEFTASLQIADEITSKGFNTKKFIKFRLCGRHFEFTFIELAGLLGFHDNSPGARKLYLTNLNKARADPPPEYNLLEFWDEIGMEPYRGRNCKESHLANPVVRLLHRYLVHTILYSGQPDKVNGERILGLYYLLKRTLRWHIPLVLCRMFHNSKGDTQTKLSGGQFVTQIALALGVLTDEVVERCGGGKEQTWLGRTQMVKSMYLKRLPNGEYVQYAVGEKKDEEPEPSNRGKRTRAGPSHQADEPMVNLQYVVRQNHEVGRYLDQVFPWCTGPTYDPRCDMRHPLDSRIRLSIMSIGHYRQLGQLVWKTSTSTMKMKKHEDGLERWSKV